MNKIMFIFVAVFTMLFISCSNDDNYSFEEYEVNNKIYEYIVKEYKERVILDYDIKDSFISYKIDNCRTDEWTEYKVYVNGEYVSHSYMNNLLVVDFRSNNGWDYLIEGDFIEVYEKQLIQKYYNE